MKYIPQDCGCDCFLTTPPHGQPHTIIRGNWSLKKSLINWHTSVTHQWHNVKMGCIETSPTFKLELAHASSKFSDSAPDQYVVKSTFRQHDISKWPITHWSHCTTNNETDHFISHLLLNFQQNTHESMPVIYYLLALMLRWQSHTASHVVVFA